MLGIFNLVYTFTTHHLHMSACYSEIMRRVIHDDEHAFAELYHSFRDRLTRFSYSITRSPQTAEETVGDVFVQLWCNRRRAGEIRDITVYLYTSVKNRSLNVLSRKSYDVITAPFDFINIELQPLVETPYDVLVTREMTNRMQQAIESLPPRCKMIFKLVREDGLQYKEVAGILNISIKTIDAQMAIAVKKICASVNITRKKSLLRRAGFGLF